MTLRFNDTLGFHIPPTSYLKTEVTQGGAITCYNMIMYSAVHKDIVLGDVFLENYYTVLDYDRELIGFNGWVQMDLPIEERRPSRKTTTIIIIIITCALVLLAAIAAFIIIKRRNSKLAKNLDLYNQLEEHENQHDHTNELY